MLVFPHRKKQRRYVIGGGLGDWIPSITRALGAAGKFLSANKETIKNVASTAGSVAKAGSTTVSAVKQIVDAVRAKRPTLVAKVPEKVLSEKSLELLTELARTPAQSSDINSQIAGAGFKRLGRR
jgi:hypothetical protein